MIDTNMPLLFSFDFRLDLSFFNLTCPSSNLLSCCHFDIGNMYIHYLYLPTNIFKIFINKIPTLPLKSRFVYL